MRKTARLDLNSIKLSNGGAWLLASTRLVLHMRAAQVHHPRPYASEGIYFWRFITEADLSAMVERALGTGFRKNPTWFWCKRRPRPS